MESRTGLKGFVDYNIDIRGTGRDPLPCEPSQHEYSVLFRLTVY